MSVSFKALSLSYRTAPLAVRERFALNEEQTKAFSVKIKELFGFNDLLVVSTCNRTEIYYNSEVSHSEALVKLLSIEKGIDTSENYLAYFELFEDTLTAVRHLFEVSAGLHAKVVGDIQIPNQVKQAYQWAADSQVAGPFLHRLMHTIFFANKRIAQETAFRDGAASVSYASVELIAELTQQHTKPNVLVVGLGEIGADVVKNLIAKDFANITLINRTREKAEKWIHEGVRVADFENLTDELLSTDVVVSSVRMDNPLFTKNLVESLNILTFKYFIDLSVPRSIATDIEEVPGALCYTIDDIQNKANAALARRLAAVPAVEVIINEVMATFEDWAKEMSVSPALQKFKQTLEQIQREEIARQFKNLSPEESERFEKLTSGIINKILRLPAVHLKAACKRGDAEQLAEGLGELFDLERFSEATKA